MAGLTPIRKVAVGALGGLPIATLIPVALGLLGIQLPEPMVGLIGAALTALIAYLVPSAPHEVAPTYRGG
jgi:hypothetical protein